MRHIKNIEISEKNNRKIEQAESTGKYWILAFLAIAWFTRTEYVPAQEVHLLRASYVTHDTPGQDSSLINLISDWFH